MADYVPGLTQGQSAVSIMAARGPLLSVKRSPEHVFQLFQTFSGNRGDEYVLHSCGKLFFHVGLHLFIKHVRLAYGKYPFLDQEFRII